MSLYNELNRRNVLRAAFAYVHLLVCICLCGCVSVVVTGSRIAA
jgi:hypothetical protein